MFFIKITSPRDALAEEDRAMIADGIISGLTGSALVSEEDVPEETMRRARRMVHVGFTELDRWTTGDGPWKSSDPPPLWLTITVPEAWREDTARHTIGWIRRVVRDFDAQHGWQRDPASLWINLVGIEDKSIGLGGKPSSADDVLAHMTEEFRAAVDKGRTVPEGSVIDPMCGMLVKLGPRAITLEHDGETLGFCAEGCRDGYARRYLSTTAS